VSAVAAPYLTQNVPPANRLSALTLPEDWDSPRGTASVTRENAPDTAWHRGPSIWSSQSVVAFERDLLALVSEFSRWIEGESFPTTDLDVEREIVVSLPPLQVREVTAEVYFAGPAKPQIFHDPVDAEEN